MNHLKKFRIINEIERTIIFDSLLKISPNILPTLSGLNYKLFISFENLSWKYNFPHIYLFRNFLIEFLKNLEPEITISSLGLYFGYIKKNQFFISIEGAEFLHKLKILHERHHITINDEGEKSILYGNKIIKKFIFKIPITLKKNDFLLVFNQSNELIAISQSQIDYNTIQDLKPKDVVASNLVDKGYYLRVKQ